MSTEECGGECGGDQTKRRALRACEALVVAYEEGERAGGSVKWEDVDDAYQLARGAVGPAREAELAAQVHGQEEDE